VFDAVVVVVVAAAVVVSSRHVTMAAVRMDDPRFRQSVVI